MPADIDSYKLNKIFTSTPGDLSAEQQELLNEVKATKTTPRDPRFPTQNQGEYKKYPLLVPSNFFFHSQIEWYIFSQSLLEQVQRVACVP